MERNNLNRIKQRLEEKKKEYMNLNEMVFGIKSKRYINEEQMPSLGNDIIKKEVPEQTPIVQKEVSANNDMPVEHISEKALPKLKEIRRIVLMELQNWTETDAVSHETYKFFDSIKTLIDKEMDKFTKK